MIKTLIALWGYYTRMKALRSTRVMLRCLNKIIEEVETAVRHEDFNQNRYPQYWNNELFFSVALRDITITYRQFLLSSEKNEKNLIARSLALHCYEFLKDFQKLTGKDFRMELQTIPFSENVVKQFDSLKATYKRILDAYEGTLEEVRHNSIAHKSKDALIFVSSIKNTNALKIQEAQTFIFILFHEYSKFHRDTNNHLCRNRHMISNIPYVAKRKVYPR